MANKDLFKFTEWAGHYFIITQQEKWINKLDFISEEKLNNATEYSTEELFELWEKSDKKTPNDRIKDFLIKKI